MLIHDVEQNTEEWLALRAGKPTASNFSKLVTSKGEVSKSLSGYALTLAGELYAGKPLDAWQGNKHTERGHELEAAAISLYEFANDCTVERAGFVTDDKQTYGCSPDGLVGSSGGIEVKCQEAKGHIETLMYYNKHDKCPPLYVRQTQGQMWVCERKWCDLVFYHPELPLLTFRQEIDISFCAALNTQIKAVIEERDVAVEAIRKQAGA